MSYSTIGLTGLDLLFMSDSDKQKFYSKVQKMQKREVDTLITEIQATVMSVKNMLEEGTLIKDSSSEKYKELVRGTGYLRDQLKDEQHEDEIILEDELSMTFEFDEDLTEEFNAELIEENEVYSNLKYSETENLGKDLLYDLPQKIYYKNNIELNNLLLSLQKDYISLPVKFKEDKKDEIDNICEKIITAVAEQLDEAESIIKSLRVYYNGTSENNGIPINYSYDRPMYVEALIRTMNSEMTTTRGAKRNIIMLNNLLREKIREGEGKELREEVKEDLEIEIEKAFPGKQFKKSLSSTVRRNIEYYYEILMGVREVMVKEVFGNRYSYDKDKEEVSKRLIKDYGIFTLLPFQESIMIAGSQMLPDVEDKASKRVLNEEEVRNITIVRNALLGNKKFRSGR